MSKNQTIIAVVVILVVLGGALLFMQMGNSSTQNSPQPAGDTTAPQPTMAAESSPSSDSAQTAGTVKEFTVAGSNFKFAPSTLTVNKGDTVKITFTSSGAIHDFVLPEFKVQSKQISSGSDTVTFTADKTGSFEFYCSIGNHKAMGMKGTLIVQ